VGPRAGLGRGGEEKNSQPPPGQMNKGQRWKAIILTELHLQEEAAISEWTF
jgi:hypothetical protein